MSQPREPTPRETELDAARVLNPTTPFLRLENIWTEAPVDSSGQSVTKFKLFLGYFEEGAPPLVIYDNCGMDGRGGSVKGGILDYSLQGLERQETTFLRDSLPKAVWAKVEKLIDDHKCRATQDDPDSRRYAIFKVVGALHDLDIFDHIDWRGCIDNIVNYRGEGIDPRLLTVRKTFLMRGHNQKENNHSVVAFPANTGKTDNPAWQTIDKVSRAGTIGYADTDGPHPGILHGMDFPVAFDQFESQSGWDIFGFLPTYMEKGEATVSQAGISFRIRGEAPIAILANPKSDNPAKSFSVLIQKMTGISAFGRRFGTILYDTDATRLKSKLSDYDLENWKSQVAIYRAVEEMCWPKIVKLLENAEVWKWINGRPTDWIGSAMRTIESLGSEESGLHDFLSNFIQHGHTHMRGGAIRAAIAYNLPRIYAGTLTPEELISEAEGILHDLLNINTDSLAKITSNFKTEKAMARNVIYESLPKYLREFVIAVQVYKTRHQQENLALPYEFPLNSVEYHAVNFGYLSQAIKKGREGDPTKYNPELKENFGFEVRREDGTFEVVLGDFTPWAPKGVDLSNLADLSNLSTLAPRVEDHRNPMDKSVKMDKMDKTTPPKDTPTTPKPDDYPVEIAKKYGLEHTDPEENGKEGDPEA